MTALVLPTNADWYLMRASGFIALILLTASLCLGIANFGRLARGAWSRTVAALVHRNASLLAVLFVVIHVLTAINDRYVKIPALSILIPGLSHYDPFWVGLGAASVDLLIAVVLTSLLRGHLSYRAWQAVHWLSYAVWPTAFVHAIGSGSGTGTDTGAAWSTLIYVVCGLTFAAALAARLWLRQHPPENVPPQFYRATSGQGVPSPLPERQPVAAGPRTRR